MRPVGNRNQRATDRCLWVVAPVALIALARGADAAPGVLVWSDEPATAAVRDAGFEPVAFAPIAARLDAQREAARDAEGDALAAVQTALGEVTQAYLEQRFDDMITRLTALETEAIGVLARPEHTGVLWEVEFQLGLAYQARGADGDAERARARFELAQSLDAERRPLKDLYGPTVATAFAEAVAARAGKTPRPIAIRASPPDARVAIDGVPVVDAARPRSLRLGLHAVRASAPGYRTHAAIATVGDGAKLVVGLRPAAGEDAGATPDTVSGLRAIRAIAAEAGAAAVVFVDRDATSGATRVRVVTAHEVSAPVAGVADALALLSPDATLRDEPEVGPIGGPAEPATPIYKKWWFWTALGAVAITAAAVSVAGSDEPGRIRVFGPGEGP